MVYRPRITVAVLTSIIAGIYFGCLLYAKTTLAIAGIIVVGVLAILGLGRSHAISPIRRSYEVCESCVNVTVIAIAILIFAVLRNDSYLLLLIATILVFVMAGLGLTLQFAYAGILNFSTAAFMGVGAYTAALMTQHTNIPLLIVLISGGLIAALIGFILVVPVLRTRGHYVALITIAFSVMFTRFLEASDLLGGPQGLPVGPMSILNWNFAESITVEGHPVSFYMSYVIFALLLVLITFEFIRRIDRSLIGLYVDSVRLDEITSATFGLSVVKWKAYAFTLGNFILGVAGAFFATMVGYVTPTDFTFDTSLVLVAIVLLGGKGNLWGLIVTTIIVVALPQKLQSVQEYRLLIFSGIVTLILLLRPEGIIGRAARSYFPKDGQES